MSKNPKRIPWMATITALMEELNRHIDQPVDLRGSDNGPERKTFKRKILDNPP
jgi:hypothetical protein